MSRAYKRKIVSLGGECALRSPEMVPEAAGCELPPPSFPQYPCDWRKGALLNVRNYGERYIITLYPEEYDPQRPDRSISYTNVGECQQFISDWYARESHDPRAR